MYLIYTYTDQSFTAIGFCLNVLNQAFHSLERLFPLYLFRPRNVTIEAADTPTPRHPTHTHTHTPTAETHTSNRAVDGFQSAEGIRGFAFAGRT